MFLSIYPLLLKRAVFEFFPHCFWRPLNNSDLFTSQKVRQLHFHKHSRQLIQGRGQIFQNTILTMLLLRHTKMFLSHKRTLTTINHRQIISYELKSNIALQFSRLMLLYGFNFQSVTISQVIVDTFSSCSLILKPAVFKFFPECMWRHLTNTDFLTSQNIVSSNFTNTVGNSTRAAVLACQNLPALVVIYFSLQFSIFIAIA